PVAAGRLAVRADEVLEPRRDVAPIAAAGPEPLGVGRRRLVAHVALGLAPVMLALKVLVIDREPVALIYSGVALLSLLRPDSRPVGHHVPHLHVGRAEAGLVVGRVGLPVTRILLVRVVPLAFAVKPVLD